MRALPRPQAQVLARQPVLRRLPVVLRPVAQALVRLVLQALALALALVQVQVQVRVRVRVQQEYLLSMLRAQNRVGPVVQV